MGRISGNVLLPTQEWNFLVFCERAVPRRPPHLCAKFPIAFFSCVGPLFPSGLARGADWEVRKRFVAGALVAKAARIFRTENPQLPSPILAQSSQILRCPALQLERFAGRLCGGHAGRDRRVKNAATLHRSLKQKKTSSVTEAKF